MSDGQSAAVPVRPRARLPRRVTRRGVAGVLSAVLLVTLAMVGHRLSDASQQFELVTGTLDHAVPYESGHLVVGDVRVASRLRVGDQVLTTPGVFVVVQVSVQAGSHDLVNVLEAQLLAPGGATYLPYAGDFTLSAIVGFESSQAVVFEVDPADLAGLTLECSDHGLVYRYYTKVHTPLGITGANAAAWAAAGRGAELGVSLSEQSKALS